MHLHRLAVVLLAACIHPPPPPVVADASLNLGFEAVVGDIPEGWIVGPPTDGFVVTSDAVTARTGARSVRITAMPGRQFGSLGRRVDAAPMVGKRVRLHAWVKTQGVTGWASGWLRVDGGEATYLYTDGPHGTSEGWSEVVGDAFIASGAEVTFGVMLEGDGAAWFDDVSLEIIEPAKLVPIELAGAVLDPAGAPVADADVALVPPAGDIAAHVRTDDAGRFTFTTTSGKWGLSAAVSGRPELVGAFLAQAEYPVGRSDLALQLAGAGGVAVGGHLEGPLPADVWLQVAAYSTFDADIFPIPVAADGSFGASLPRADRYAVSVLSGGVGSGEAARDDDHAQAKLSMAPALPAPPAVVEWISQSAVPLATVDPTADLAELTRLARSVGDARVVALGEATHGTHEFFQLKHRLFAYLVHDLGFTVFALEMGQVEARTINAYVLDGTGSARGALGAGRMWIWEVEELLAQIEWMRAWNANPAHVRKVQFVGFDLQDPTQSYQAVQRYLGRVAPDEAAALLAPLDILRRASGRTAFVALSEADSAAVLTSVADLLARFDAARGAWEGASSPAEFAVARHDARILQQGAEQFSAQTRPAVGSALRDRAMAENIEWLLDQLPPDSRVVVSAHNSHVADVVSPTVSMGHELRAALGGDLLAVGLELGDGEFQALQSRQDGAHANVEVIRLPPPTDGLANEAFLRSGLPLYALDLRALPAEGPVSEWFRAPQLVREAGYRVGVTPGWVRPQALPERYDMLLFVAHTSRARPLPVDLARTP